MPNIKSAIKRVKVTEKKNLRNRMIKSAMRTSIKKFDTAISAGTADAKLLSATSGAVDKAAAKGVIHKNAANRKKAPGQASGEGPIIPVSFIRRKGRMLRHASKGCKIAFFRGVLFADPKLNV